MVLNRCFFYNKKFITLISHIRSGRNFTGYSFLMSPTFCMFSPKANSAPTITKNSTVSRFISRNAFSDIVWKDSKWHKSLNFYPIEPVLTEFSPKFRLLPFIFRPRFRILIIGLSFSTFLERCARKLCTVELSASGDPVNFSPFKRA